MTASEYLEFALRLLAAIGCGAVIGWERETRGKSAGFQTHTLVALGSCLFTLAALGFFASTQESRLELDPARLIQGIAVGIGFLGAGCILQHRHSIQGLTTAATVWVDGAIGVTCGLGNYPLALLGLLGTMVVLIVFRAIERRFQHNANLNEAAEPAGTEAGQQNRAQSDLPDRTSGS